MMEKFDMKRDFVRSLQGMLGKTIRDLFDKEYLNCDCKVCKKLTKFHQNTDESVEWLMSLAKNPTQSVAVKEH